MKPRSIKTALFTGGFQTVNDEKTTSLRPYTDHIVQSGKFEDECDVKLILLTYNGNC